MWCRARRSWSGVFAPANSSAMFTLLRVLAGVVAGSPLDPCPYSQHAPFAVRRIGSVLAFLFVSHTD